jgi:fumarate reductase flavoprotein subunit
VTTVLRAEGVGFDVEVPVLVVGAGAAGLVAGIAAREEGAEVLLLERYAVPRGSTALSAGLIPAAGTMWQRAAGIADDPDILAGDISRKCKGQADRAAVDTVARAIGPVLDHLGHAHGLAFSVITDFAYPGHSVHRMHGLADRSGLSLVDALRAAAERAGVEIMTDARATTLFARPDGGVAGVEIARPDGARERIGCRALVLACNGYGGNKALVARHVPSLAEGLYFGHAGNQGDAVLWGEALGAATADLGGHQGHGSVAHPHGILITWATMTEGGFQVNRDGLRFHDESRGYSEAAADVLAQPDGLAWSIFDARVAGIARQFEDFRRAEAQGAVLLADDIAALAARAGLPAGALAATLAEIGELRRDGAVDRFGRDWRGAKALLPPYAAVKVTGALFHTQGGLVVDSNARVLRPDRSPLPNLFAAGGAARGVSGSDASGYLSGNGLLTAVAYGFLAGREAARRIDP